MTTPHLEKTKIIFNEAKEMLKASTLNSEILQQKISRFVTICVASIGILTGTFPFLNGTLTGDGNLFWV